LPSLEAGITLFVENHFVKNHKDDDETKMWITSLKILMAFGRFLDIKLKSSVGAPKV
jgi:hypothetical protein